MQILLADAKTMKPNKAQPADRLPHFESVAATLASEMAEADVDDLKADLKCSAAIAADALRAFRNYATTPPCRALTTYDGTAYKHLRQPKCVRRLWLLPTHTSGLRRLCMDSSALPTASGPTA